MDPSVFWLLASLANSVAAAWRVAAVSMEKLPFAAFVLDAHGRLLHANSLGADHLSRDPAVAVRLAESVRRPLADFDIQRVSATTGVDCYVVFASATESTVASSAAAQAAERWQLTPRQRAVLECLLRGYSNARISEELGITERTVEVHVTALLDRADCSSRAELIVSAFAPS